MADAHLMIGGLLLNLIVTVAVAIWKLSRVEVSLRQAISRAEKETDARIDHLAGDMLKRYELLANDMLLRLDTVRREFGETVAAMRTKVTEIELFGRDTYMRRDSFYKVQEAVEANIKTLEDKMEKRFDRMEAKIDTKT